MLQSGSTRRQAVQCAVKCRPTSLNGASAIKNIESAETFKKKKEMNEEKIAQKC